MSSIASTLDKINLLFKNKIRSAAPSLAAQQQTGLSRNASIASTVPIGPSKPVGEQSSTDEAKKLSEPGFSMRYEDMKSENVEDFDEEYTKYNFEEERVVPFEGQLVEGNEGAISSVHNDLIQKKVSRIAMASKTTKRPDSQKSKRQLLQEKEEERLKLKSMRKSAGEVWVDPNMALWQDNDYRIFCGNLGNEVTDDVLSNSFKKFASFSRARVVRDKRSQKTKGFGFVSFLDPQDFLKAFKEMQGKYIGNRPVKLSKSDWETRSFGAKKDDELGNNFLRKGIQKGKQQTIKH